MAHDRDALDHFLDDHRLKSTLDPQAQEDALRGLVVPGTIMTMDGNVAFTLVPPAHIGTLDASNLDEPDYAEALQIWLNTYFPPHEVALGTYHKDGEVSVTLKDGSAQRFMDIMRNKPSGLPDHRALVDEVANDDQTAAAIIDRTQTAKLQPSGELDVNFSIPREQEHAFSGRLRERYGPRISFTSPIERRGMDTSPMMMLGATLHGDAAERFLIDHQLHARQ